MHRFCTFERDPPSSQKKVMARKASSKPRQHKHIKWTNYSDKVCIHILAIEHMHHVIRHEPQCGDNI